MTDAQYIRHLKEPVTMEFYALIRDKNARLERIARLLENIDRFIAEQNKDLHE